MKSGARDFGAAELASMGLELEEMGKSGDLVGMNNLVERAESEYAKIESRLETMPNDDPS